MFFLTLYKPSHNSRWQPKVPQNGPQPEQQQRELARRQQAKTAAEAVTQVRQFYFLERRSIL